jgi:UDP-N-acetylglucosamine 4,6-dehydratase
LITGGTGSFGKAFLRVLLEQHNPDRVVIFSRDELKQYEMKTTMKDDPRVRYFLGDVRDLERLKMAFYGVNFVVHAAALKQVDTAEYNPMEYIKTNILGSENVMQASIANGVQKVIALSTDKASSPVNLYGATKLTSDKLFISGNHYAARRGTSFAVVRYGNVIGSRGSVIPFFRSLAAKGAPIPITDERMTRFWITLDQAVNFVINGFDSMKGGELYVPKIPSMKVIDLAHAIAPDSKQEVVGVRPGEKLHEEMISREDAGRTIALQDKYIIMPSVAEWGYSATAGLPVPDGFSYASNTNDLWLSTSEISALLLEQGL